MDDQPPVPDGVEIQDCADTREHVAHEPENTSEMVAPALLDAPDGRRNDEGAAALPDPASNRTLVLPDEVLVMVFNFCDARTLTMALPVVSRRWLSVCQMLRAAIDLTWAVRRYGCAITNAGLAGLVLRFPNLRHLNLKRCKNVTDGGVEAVAAGCPNLQHLNLNFCKNV